MSLRLQLFSHRWLLLHHLRVHRLLLVHNRLLVLRWLLLVLIHGLLRVLNHGLHVFHSWGPFNYIFGSRLLNVRFGLPNLLVSQKFRLHLLESSSILLKHVLILHSVIANGQLELLLGNELRLNDWGPVHRHLNNRCLLHKL